MKRVSFKTLGCRLNQAETAELAARFAGAGFLPVPFPEPADVCVVHTCAVTSRAEQSCVQAARLARRRNPSALIVLAGCAVELDRETLLRRTGADLTAGQDSKFDLPAAVQKELARRTGANPPQKTAREGSVTPLHDTTRASVKVQDGCEFFCAYCVVPHTRGPSKSRPITEVTDEVRRLVAAGFLEVILTGANLGCYRDGDRDLVALIRAVERIPGLARVRISSVEISTVERSVIDHMATSDKLCHFMHIPMQSGDDRILNAMGRHYTAEAYARTVEYAAARMPDIGLGTDVIVGFPGEDEAAFNNTFNIIARLPFSNVHVFPYNKRPRTRAAELPHQVRESDKRERVKRLLALAERRRAAFAASFQGRTVQILTEHASASEATGLTREYLSASVEGNGFAINSIVDAIVTGMDGDTLLCKPCGPSGIA